MVLRVFSLIRLNLNCVFVACAQKLSAYNTRLFKRDNGGKACYEVRLASAVQKGKNYGFTRERE